MAERKTPAKTAGKKGSVLPEYVKAKDLSDLLTNKPIEKRRCDQNGNDICRRTISSDRQCSSLYTKSA